MRPNGPQPQAEGEWPAGGGRYAGARADVAVEVVERGDVARAAVQRVLCQAAVHAPSLGIADVVAVQRRYPRKELASAAILVVGRSAVEQLEVGRQIRLALEGVFAVEHGGGRTERRVQVPELLSSIQAVVAKGDVGPAVAIAIDAERAPSPASAGFREVRPAAVGEARRVVDAARRRHDSASNQGADRAVVPLHAVCRRVVQVLVPHPPCLIDFVVALAAGRPRPVGQGHGVDVAVLGTEADEAAVPVAPPGQAECLLGASAVVRMARRSFQGEAVEILAQDGVGDAGNGIGTVDGGSAVEQLIVLLHQNAGHDAQVRRCRRPLHARRRDATAVQQHQRALRAKAAKVGGGGARPVVEDEALEGQVELHARRRAGFLQNLACIDEAGLALDVRADDLQRRDARVGAAPDARAGNDDLFDARLFGLRQGGRRGLVFGLLLLRRFVGLFGCGLLRQRRRGDKASQGQDCREQQGRLGELGLRPYRDAPANDALRESHGGNPPRLSLRAPAPRVPRLGNPN